MYKFLLCWRYLRTRWIALASIVSVTLGVATMIVVNSVMSGFTTEMQDRIHGILSDLEVRGHSMGGFYDADRVMREIMRVAGDDIASLTPTVQVPAMLSFQYGGQTVTRQVMMVGIDADSHASASDFGKYLLHPDNRDSFSFDLREAGWPTRDHQAGPEAPERTDLKVAGWGFRRWKAQQDKQFHKWQEDHKPQGEAEAPAEPDESDDAAEETGPSAADLFAQRDAPVDEGHVFDPEREQHHGVVLGIALASYLKDDKSDGFLLLPGDDVQLTLPTAGTPPRAVDDSFTIVDFYESKMSEYDGNLVFVPIERLQELRGMIDPETGVGFVTSIQIKLKDPSRGTIVRDKLRQARLKDPRTGAVYPLFPPDVFGIVTWRDKQGPLLAAVQMETAILNVLLFMIIAVAGFGILAIFFMIVVEKTRDIGILKSLGASATGIMGIFLSYGLSLGAVGAGAGMLLGLLFVAYINEIADALAAVTGQEVFDPSIYYFYEIPTIVEPFTVGWIVVGAMAIAVLASVLPALRAARLHPVEALRYE